MDFFESFLFILISDYLLLIILFLHLDFRLLIIHNFFLILGFLFLDGSLFLIFFLLKTMVWVRYGTLRDLIRKVLNIPLIDKLFVFHW